MINRSGGLINTVSMAQGYVNRVGRVMCSLLSGGFLLGLSGPLAKLQAAFPPCPPPQANEYLLLVRSNTEAERNRVQALLPSNSTVMICDYLNDTVVRAGGFTNLENANAWAQYMTEVEGLKAFVARPAASAPTPTTPSTPTPTAGPGPTPPAAPSPTPPAAPSPAPSPPPAQVPPSPSVAYTPQSLGTGFGVLVDYQYQPEIAKSIQRQVKQAVGLAVYRQRPYLLIAYSPNIDGAVSTLTVLKGYGISSFIVDSREVVMLTPAVAGPN